MVKIGVAGPVGSGKTALIEALTRQMAKEYSIGVITNDIYTKEDAEGRDLDDLFFAMTGGEKE